MMEEFSGIPVKALLENDEKMTELDLSDSGCGVTEACVLAECLKVFFWVCLVPRNFLICSVTAGLR